MTSGWNMKIYRSLFLKCSFFPRLFNKCKIILLKIGKTNFVEANFSKCAIFLQLVAFNWYYYNEKLAKHAWLIFEIRKFFEIGYVNIQLFTRKSAKVILFRNDFFEITWAYTTILRKISKNCLFAIGCIDAQLFRREEKQLALFFHAQVFLWLVELILNYFSRKWHIFAVDFF